jgi:hypothetical protein
MVTASVLFTPAHLVLLPSPKTEIVIPRCGFVRRQALLYGSTPSCQLQARINYHVFLAFERFEHQLRLCWSASWLYRDISKALYLIELCTNSILADECKNLLVYQKPRAERLLIIIRSSVFVSTEDITTPDDHHAERHEIDAFNIYIQTLQSGSLATTPCREDRWP